jgi:hypothetical protein
MSRSPDQKSPAGTAGDDVRSEAELQVDSTVGSSALSSMNGVNGCICVF